MEEDPVCWLCGGEGCRLCGYTGVECSQVERDWLEAAKEEKEINEEDKSSIYQEDN